VGICFQAYPGKTQLCRIDPTEDISNQILSALIVIKGDKGVFDMRTLSRNDD
jgi:hypothetical protein